MPSAADPRPMSRTTAILYAIGSFCPVRRACRAVLPADLDDCPQSQAAFSSARLALVASPHQISWSSMSLAEGKIASSITEIGWLPMPG